MAETKDKTIRDRFKRLDSARSHKLERAREHAQVVMPSLLPDTGFGQDDDLPVPWSAMPAEGVMNLSTQLVDVLYPLNNLPFFELSLSTELDIAGVNTTAERQVLDRIGRRVMEQFLPTNYRSALFMSMQHLIVIGDVLLHERDDYSFQVFRLDQYVVLRRPNGQPVEIIVQEWVNPDSIPEELKGISKDGAQKEAGTENQFEAVYTRLFFDDETKLWNVEREFRTSKFDTGTSYSVLPYFPLRWSAVAGEDYGRSLIEDAFGDIIALEALSKSLVDGAVMNSEWRWLCNPGGHTEPEDFDNSQNGATIAGIEGDLTFLQAGAQAQLIAVLTAVQDREQRLGRRFLMNSAVQPEGERVTARQVTILAHELERALGGVLTLQAGDIQIPVVRRTMYQMSTDLLIPPGLAPFTENPDSLLKIKVKAGLEVLRRELDNQKLMAFAQVAATLPAEAQALINWGEWLNQWIVTFGIEPTGLVKSPEQVAAEATAAAAEQRAMEARQASDKAVVAAASRPPPPQGEEVRGG